MTDETEQEETQDSGGTVTNPFAAGLIDEELFETLDALQMAVAEQDATMQGVRRWSLMSLCLNFTKLLGYLTSTMRQFGRPNNSPGCLTMKFRSKLNNWLRPFKTLERLNLRYNRTQ